MGDVLVFPSNLPASHASAEAALYNARVGYDNKDYRAAYKWMLRAAHEIAVNGIFDAAGLLQDIDRLRVAVVYAIKTLPYPERTA